MIDNGTFGVGWTIARVTAVLFTTSQSAGTVFVDQTFRQATSAVRIAFVTFWTEALGAMEIDLANGVGSTRFKDTRILTLTIDTSFGRWTIGIGSTSNYSIARQKLNFSLLGKRKLKVIVPWIH